ncbi:MAG: cyclase family protein [Verrucomicrobiota bacterium]
MELHDISVPLSERLAPWPGDTSVRFALNLKISEGATVNVGAVTMSMHSGTHVDAPFHFEENGATIENLSLEIYFGPAVVVDLSKTYSGPTEGFDSSRMITVDDLAAAVGGQTSIPRLLVKTNFVSDRTVFPDEIPVIAPNVPLWLKERGTKLIGLDLPSVDRVKSKDLRNHRALLRCGIMILESLDLSQIEDGVYNLAAFPLKIADGDASPVRAVLWR